MLKSPLLPLVIKFTALKELLPRQIYINFQLLLFLWILWPFKIISFNSSHADPEPGQTRVSRVSHLTTQKQKNLACFTCGPSRTQPQWWGLNKLSLLATPPQVQSQFLTTYRCTWETHMFYLSNSWGFDCIHGRNCTCNLFNTGAVTEKKEFTENGECIPCEIIWAFLHQVTEIGWHPKNSVDYRRVQVSFVSGQYEKTTTAVLTKNIFSNYMFVYRKM